MNAAYKRLILDLKRPIYLNWRNEKKKKVFYANGNGKNSLVEMLRQNRL